MTQFAAKFKRLTDTGDKNFAEVIRHSMWALALLTVAAAVQFIFDLVLARSFGPSGAGVFYLCFSVLTTLALLGRLGLDRAVIRYIPPMAAAGNRRAIKGVCRSATMLSLVTTVVLGSLLFFGSDYLAHNVFGEPQIAGYLKIFALALPPLSLISVYGGVLRALKQTRSALAVERLITYGLGAAGILALAWTWGVQAAIISFAVATYVAAALAAFAIAKELNKAGPVVPFKKSQLFQTGWPLLFVVFATQMVGQVSVLMLGASSESTSVGVFNIALKVSILLSIVLGAINTISGTKISELYHAGKHKQLEKILSKTSALALAFSLPILLVMLFFPEFLLGLFGPQFVMGGPALMILALGQFIAASTGSVAAALATTGHQKPLAFMYAVSFAMNIALGAVLIPVWGVVGAAVTTTVVMAANNIASVLLVKRYLNIWQSPLATFGVWAASIKHFLKRV